MLQLTVTYQIYEKRIGIVYLPSQSQCPPPPPTRVIWVKKKKLYELMVGIYSKSLVRAVGKVSITCEI